jgi:predicted ATPase
MLTKLIIENFKKLDEVEIDLAPTVAFVGPNNSGKTTALQAISLWGIGMRRWIEHSQTARGKQRIKSITINRKELLSMPVPSALQLWNDLNVRKSVSKKDGSRGTNNIRIQITAEGFTDNINWKLGFEFDYANPESIYCRIINNSNGTIPEVVIKEKIGFLPPMSGLATEEDKLEAGSIQGRIGEGRTAEVLRNLCWNVYQQQNDKWGKLKTIIKRFFRIELDDPIYEAVTGKLSITYKEGSNKNMALTNAGRGFQQILLLFSYIYSNENSILLLDEPDAHLEVIRQKEVYNILSDMVKDQKSQLIIATHSEAVLNEAAGKDTIIGFIGAPHIVNKTQQLVKSLNNIGFDQYILAQQKKWVLFLEGTTDQSILVAFARILNHPALPYIEEAFVRTVDTNRPIAAENIFYGLKEAIPDLLGVALFDRLEKQSESKKDLSILMWEKREIENYLPLPDVLERFIAKEYDDKELFTQNYWPIMKAIIDDYVPGVARKNRNDEWWKNTKMSDDFLDKIFRDFYKKIDSVVLMDKSRYYKLVELSNPDELDKEIKQKLDTILNISRKAETIVNKRA